MASDTQTSETSKSPLDDLMIAMDVVDTLRHDRKLVDRELNDEGRRRDLIDRLREIYRGQGIDVPDHILEEGVSALEEDRFVYKAPDPDAWKTKIAKLYVSRSGWGRYVLGGLAGIVLIFLGNYFFIERPRQAEARAAAYELTERLPASINKLAADIRTESRDDKVIDEALAVATSGRNAASSKDLKAARAAEATLKETLERLRQDFDIRVVNRSGEVSGLWRVPNDAPNTYNFYLVVEAIGKDGQPVAQWITNEETGKRERVKIWAQRVDRSVLVRVQEDKEDDGIIQNAIVGQKSRGELEPKWTIDVAGGAITRWN